MDRNVGCHSRLEVGYVLKARRSLVRERSLSLIHFQRHSTAMSECQMQSRSRQCVTKIDLCISRHGMNGQLTVYFLGRRWYCRWWHCHDSVQLKANDFNNGASGGYSTGTRGTGTPIILRPQYGTIGSNAFTPLSFFTPSPSYAYTLDFLS